ncbi:protein-glutamate methylesterase/protein-glutamine glutaminase [Thalassoroseus pseudoceratinae]|uniref:protein-glutamate methylesterase/protein-glutamine glutaminase n=1 Tax=Thalassoroseus pseudoceratinae TaxID=2713176 RepID=UPI0014243AB2|nr:chemotaxis response regulator protein-glutamate methylesterase [Thalassoroseus pseudoceratinae]
MVQQPIRMLVVDDSLLYRKIVRDALEAIPGVEVVGSAGDGIAAVEKIERYRPDLITLDLEMPRMNGIEVLDQLRSRQWSTKAIMISGANQSDAERTMNALRRGAFDFIVKPRTDSIEHSRQKLIHDLSERIEAFRIKTQRVQPTIPVPAKPASLQESWRTRASGTIEAVAIGISTGGPDALRQLIPQLPADFPAPILIVQHMPPMFTRLLANGLNSSSALNVREAQCGNPMEPGNVYIAPGGKQMKVVKIGDDVHVKITDDPPENSCRPAVDYLFRSLVPVYGANTLGVIMTGMGSDGLHGCRELKNAGAKIMVQDEASCVVFGMPRFPIQEGLADEVVPLQDMATRIQRSVASKSLV